MRLAFLFGPVSTGPRPFDFDRIEDDPRGLTGTDNSFLGYARGLAGRGHAVSLFCSLQRERRTWRDGVLSASVYPYEERRGIDAKAFDAALAWNDIRGLRDVDPRVLRVLDTQINDYGYTTPEDHAAVDLYLAPSAPLARRLEPMARQQGATGAWRVAPNGCDPTVYDVGAKVPGRCIYASSPDRGLHVVLECWARIRREVPHAELRIFYHSLDKWFGEIAQNERDPQWTSREHARRATIARALIDQPGVEVVGSVSRRRMAREYSEAMVVTGPTTTISFTEGFGVAVLEGCASGAVPCISTVDAFGEIYDGACPLVEVEPQCRCMDAPGKAEEWARNVVAMLTPGAVRDLWAARGRAFAERHAWPVLAEQLENHLIEGIVRKT